MNKTLMPLYGCLQGDTIALLILAYENETGAELIKKIQTAAKTRVAYSQNMTLIHKGKPISHSATLKESGIEALDRVDCVKKG